ncbi:MAG TPA: phosphopyruvate hydratase [Gaiellaceae bacterium]|nr:phosphopyruvate hydratase [Gaiellaceae bacterium]
MELTIERVLAWEALDSRGTPTVSCVVTLAGGAEGQAAAPSGASTGSHEAHELRDGDSRFGGKGVGVAVAAVNGEIAEVLRGGDAGDQEALDALLRDLDGTPGLGRLGGNAVLAVSVACALATAAARREPLWRCLAPEGPPLLPLPMVNVLSGGAHAARAIDVQDVLVVPVGAASFAEAIEWAARVRAAAADVLRARGHPVALVADEGGLAAPLGSNREAVEIVAAAIERSGLVPREQAGIAVDVAATQLLDGTGYRFAAENRPLHREELVTEIRSWCDDFPVVSVEDPFGEDDAEGWRLASERLGHVQLLGDDLFATSRERLAEGVAAGIANAVIVKPNQAGTLSDARRVVELARSAGYATVLSARSGDTEESWLADLAVGWRTGQLKVGSTTRSERTAKWNRLLRLEAECDDARFVGRDVLAPSAMLRA